MIYHGNNIEVLKSFPDNSVDSIVTDSPYGLSFMNKHWDYDVPSIELWKECLRVLKPGGHLLSFAGTRTYHRMTVRIEDAGFEIRDMISWIYGSGFPKSLNVRLNIDKSIDTLLENLYICKAWKSKLKIANGAETLSLKNLTAISENIIKNDFAQEVVARKHSQEKSNVSVYIVKQNFTEAPLMPETNEYFAVEIVERFLPLSKQSAKFAELKLLSKKAVLNSHSIIIAEEDVRVLLKESIGNKIRDAEAQKTWLGKWLSSKEMDINANCAELIEDLKLTILNLLKTSPNYGTTYQTEQPTVTIATTTEYIKECLITNTVDILKEISQTLFDGFGTALKPSNEPVCVARKPLIGTVAENVLQHGTGGLNIDGCRIGVETIPNKQVNFGKGCILDSQNHKAINGSQNWNYSQGRFPANIIFDEIAGVMLDEQAPETGAFAKVASGKNGKSKGIYGDYKTKGDDGLTFHNDGLGGASRFFYCAKSSRSERNFGLDSYLTVKYINEKKCKEENTVAVQLLKRVISDTAQVSFNTAENGENIMALCHKDFLSITLTEINRIIELKILNLLTHSLTSEYTAGANCETGNGGNPVENAESLRKWILTITNGNQELARGASNVALQTLLLIREKESWKELNNFHSTVKPLKLMQYLVRLVTPPNGVCLDPFCGSGTTLMACVKEGFNYIGIERESDYVKIAEARVEWIKKQKKEIPEQTNLFKPAI